MTSAFVSDPDRTTSAAPPLAEWNFAHDPRRSVDGRWMLRDIPGSHAPHLPGFGISFDGIRDGLVIDSGDVGDLDVAARGDQVTVVALIRRRSWGTGFVGGMWQEDDRDPRRQYGLFVGLPTYGGAEQVVGHVSHDGRPSPGLRYSREYSASARMVAPGAWRVIGFTYDGEHIRSYLDGVSDARPDFTERGSPLGEGTSYPKNPFRYPLGLNRRVVSDFTVGVVRLTTGPGNFFAGDMARLAVWGNALSASDMLSLAHAWTPATAPLLRFDFARPDPAPRAAEGGSDEEIWPLGVVGLEQAAIGASGKTRLGIVRGHDRPVLTRTAGWGAAIAGLALPADPGAGLSIDDLAGVRIDLEDADRERVAVAVAAGGRWWTAELGDGPFTEAAAWEWRKSGADVCGPAESVTTRPTGSISAIGVHLAGDGPNARLRSFEVFTAR